MDRIVWRWVLCSCGDAEFGEDGGCGAEYDTTLGAEGNSG